MKSLKAFMLFLSVGHILDTKAVVNYLNLLYNSALGHTIILLGHNNHLKNSIAENIFIERFKAVFPTFKKNSFNVILGTNQDAIRAQIKSLSLKNNENSLFEQLSILSTHPLKLFSSSFSPNSIFSKEYATLAKNFDFDIFKPYLGDNREKGIFLLVHFFYLIKEAAVYTQINFSKARKIPMTQDAVSWINDLFFNALYQEDLLGQGLMPLDIKAWQGQFIAYLQKVIDSYFIAEYSLNSIINQLEVFKKSLTKFSKQPFTQSFIIKDTLTTASSQIDLLLPTFEKIKYIETKNIDQVIQHLKQLPREKDVVQSLIVYCFKNRTFSVLDVLSKGPLSDPAFLRKSINYLTYEYPIIGYLEIIMKEILKDKNLCIFLLTEQGKLLVPYLNQLGYQQKIVNESEDIPLDPSFFEMIVTDYGKMVRDEPSSYNK